MPDVNLTIDGHKVTVPAGTLIVEERKHPELLDQFRTGMLGPRLDQIAASLDRGKERGEVRADLDSMLAAQALMRNILFFAKDDDLVQCVFTGACEFIERVPVQQLTFRKDASVWELIG